MSTVAEIKAAVSKLSLSERAEFAKWFNNWTDDEWDRQMAADFGPGGKSEGVLKEVDSNIKTGNLREMP
jgi:hypothetical protein